MQSPSAIVQLFQTTEAWFKRVSRRAWQPQPREINALGVALQLFYWDASAAYPLAHRTLRARAIGWPLRVGCRALGPAPQRFRLVRVGTLRGGDPARWLPAIPPRPSAGPAQSDGLLSSLTDPPSMTPSAGAGIQRSSRRSHTWPAGSHLCTRAFQISGAGGAGAVMRLPS